jgi:hypothetical protein
LAGCPAQPKEQTGSIEGADMTVKTIKVADATNIQLDWLVATCEGIAFTLDASLSYYPVLVIKGEEHLVDDFYSGYSPTTRPEQMWPIIEGERMHIYAGPQWTASIRPGQFMYGRTSLIAAARCYVASKLGDTVEVPEELA